MAKRKGTHADWFWEKVTGEPNTGCWLWLGTAVDGYGKFRVGGKVVGAHRFSWELHNGPIPEGMGVLHKCDVRLCVNPAHLFLGTHQDNMADMRQKKRKVGTRLYGENNGASKLSDAQVAEIRLTTESQEIVARRYNVSRSNIGAIRTGRSRRHSQ